MSGSHYPLDSSIESKDVSAEKATVMVIFLKSYLSSLEVSLLAIERSEVRRSFLSQP